MIRTTTRMAIRCLMLALAAAPGLGRAETVPLTQLQHSADGGNSWRIVARAPDMLFDLAASAQDVKRLYAATQSGLLISDDGGLTWRSAYLFRQPATLVQTGSGRAVDAFMAGRGLLRSDEVKPGWRPIGPPWGDRVLLHLAEDPGNPDTLYAIANDGEILVSRCAGADWAPFGGH